jgi:hypothetical protein
MLQPCSQAVDLNADRHFGEGQGSCRRDLLDHIIAVDGASFSSGSFSEVRKRKGMPVQPIGAGVYRSQVTLSSFNVVHWCSPFPLHSNRRETHL